MSAVPQKKLCWNCEGNVAKNIDNCPYCGVYLHSAENDETPSLWNPSYVPSNKTEEIPTPLYQINQDNRDDTLSSDENSSSEANFSNLNLTDLFKQFKRDLFPSLFLMTGSIFFLFGVVLFLFSQNGTLTLQWKEENALYFLLFSLPLIGFGWRFLQKIDDSH